MIGPLVAHSEAAVGKGVVTRDEKMKKIAIISSF
jgi:hypothetical protein